MLSTLILVLGAGCVLPAPPPPKPLPEDVQDGQLVQAPPPHRSDEPGKQALLDWAQQCFNQGAGFNPVFNRGGSVLVRWTADREGSLLRLEFVNDTFGRWEIDSSGTTMADCISLKARLGKVSWSKRVIWSSEGLAPLRFSPAENGAAPAPGHPKAEPEPAQTAPSPAGRGLIPSDQRSAI